MAALLVERSCIDLRSQVTISGACSISSQEVKCLLSDNVRSRVWCAGPLSFSLWYAFLFYRCMIEVATHIWFLKFDLTRVLYVLPKHILFLSIKCM